MALKSYRQLRQNHPKDTPKFCVFAHPPVPINIYMTCTGKKKSKKEKLEFSFLQVSSGMASTPNKRPEFLCVPRCTAWLLVMISHFLNH